MLTKEQYFKIRKEAWLDAIRLCGGEKKLGKLIGVKQSTISDWINKPTREIPFDKVILVEKFTKVKTYRLMPEKIAVNEYLTQIRSSNKNNLIFHNLLLKQILITNLPDPHTLPPNRYIIIDTKCTLVYGATKLNELQKKQQPTTDVIILDLKTLLLKQGVLDEFSNEFTLIEKAAIGLHLKRLIGNRKGRRIGLANLIKPVINTKNLLLNRRNCSQLTGKTDKLVAKMLGFESRDTYMRVNKVYLNGCQELMNAAENKQIAISRAANIAKLAKNQQSQFINLKKE